MSPAGKTPVTKPDPPLPEGIKLVYERAQVILEGLAVTIETAGENRWRLYAALNYITTSPTPITYDEIFEGTEVEVYGHAARRLEELVKLKAQHDRVHIRVNEMSEGKP
jgi:hypothetical protein